MNRYPLLAAIALAITVHTAWADSALEKFGIAVQADETYWIVTEIMPGSTADTAGLKVGDALLEAETSDGPVDLATYEGIEALHQVLLNPPFELLALRYDNASDEPLMRFSIDGSVK